MSQPTRVTGRARAMISTRQPDKIWPEPNMTRPTMIRYNGCRLLSKCFGCLSNPLNCSYDCRFDWNKLLKVEVVEELFKINYVPRKIKWLGYVHHWEGYMDNIDLNIVFDDFASKNEVIILILEVHIYSCFCQHCFSIITKHVKLKI
jgi:hypothetical protein